MPISAVVDHNPTADKSPSDFLVKDYELKILYLCDHYTRMWSRFNYFVAIQSTLVSGKFFFNRHQAIVYKEIRVVHTVSAPCKDRRSG
jgi:hypothetical protein